MSICSIFRFETLGESTFPAMPSIELSKLTAQLRLTDPSELRHLRGDLGQTVQAWLE